MTKIADWLREATLSDDPEKLIKRCSVAAAMIDSYEKERIEYRNLAQKAFANSRAFEELYESTWDYKIKSAMSKFSDFMLGGKRGKTRNT